MPIQLQDRVSMLEPFSREKEEEIKKFWDARKIMAKARKKNAKAKKTFYFMDGPPYATGHIHMGTALNKILKDISMRSKRMQGYDVFDKPGYDTHGMPIEYKVEQKFGFKTKQDIEAFGVENFVKECRKFATEFIGVMNSEFADLGVWMDWDNPYKTLENDYIESIWWTFKKADEKGYLYKGLYPIHVCPHCATAVAFNEIEYTKQSDTAIYVKFGVKGSENKYLVIWTTTPWTLPGNTGIMVHPNFDYVEAEVGGEIWIVAKEKLQELMDTIEAGYVLKREFKGKEIENMEYENPLQHHLKLPETKNGYRVILSERYVNLDAGTGLVHTNPGCGKEDFDAGRRAGLPILSLVNLDGSMKQECGKYSEKIARVVDAEILEDLKNGNALVYQHPYTHDYPICWRCKSPLIMISVDQWFLSVKEIQKKAIELNRDVDWVPNWMKDRMRDWLQNIYDWPVTRARYWGAPCPIWLCECGKKLVVGSKAELEKAAGKKLGNLELHKPHIDGQVHVKCSKCGKEMKRVPDILDVWFDAGTSSWAALGYPKSKKLFDRYWPADLNIEATEQVRGWWNAELLCSIISFGKKPFNAIAVHGMILDLGKKKMSKSHGNNISPKNVVEKYSRDYLRYFLAKKSTGLDMVFDWEAMPEIHRFFNVFLNTYNFAEMYLKIDFSKKTKPTAKELKAEDRWILSRFNSLAKECTQAYNGFEFYKAVNSIENFVMEDLSRSYIKIIRNRIGTQTQKGVEKTLRIVLIGTLELLAPIVPFASEFIYQSLRSKKMPESVHLLQIPVFEKKLEDKALEKEFEKTKELLQAALALREEKKLRLRWPLKELVIVSKSGKEFKKTKSVIATIANIKKVSEAAKIPKGEFASKKMGKLKLFLNTKADAGLREEWELQELRRKIQELRKRAKLKPGRKAVLLLDSSDKKFLKKYSKAIQKETNTKIKQGKGAMEKLLDREFYIELETKGN
ncbi:MAG: isoleucine--tRNA ligase [Candidatus Diapherotrites archaeon]|nr:isoleucine--tRNA ligase [Candidatus Diapherotrites archaeon]